MRVTGFVVVSLLLASPVGARDWKVSDAENDPAASASVSHLRITNSQITLVRDLDQQLLREIATSDVTAIWYDQVIVKPDSTPKWLDEIFGSVLSVDTAEPGTMLVMLAIAGAGYVAAETGNAVASEHRHFANIRYRRGNSFELLTVRTSWLDHYWLMTDLSQAVRHKWMNIPQQRAKLAWSWANRTQTFDLDSLAGDVPLTHSKYDVLLWEGSKGEGILLFYTVRETGRTLVAAPPVRITKTAWRKTTPAYCRDAANVLRVFEVQLGDKLATLLSSAQACERSREARIGEKNSNRHFSKSAARPLA